MKTGITPAEAQEIILAEAERLGSERVAVGDALSRVLCEPVVSARELPPADNSAMDGYAVRSADLVGATAKAPRSLPLAFEIPAGDNEGRRLEPGAAARILTGAPLPPGADTVVRQEDTRREGDAVHFEVAPGVGEHVRRAGEDVRPGDEVLSAGITITPAEVGMLASLGRSVVSVVQRPKVAILSGGDELVEPDGDVTGGRIVSSNSYSLAAQCVEIGAEPVYLGIARDTPEDLERLFRAGLRADVLVSSAGVSVGDRDYVRLVLEKIGCTLRFWGVDMKPGYPLAFGRIEGGGPLVFGLPGNPVSAMMTFEQFVRPALRRMLGFASWFRPTVQVTLGERMTKKAGRLHFVRVFLERRDGEIVATSTGNQSSGVLRSMTLADGLLIFPAEASELSEGARATVQVLSADFFAETAPAF